MPKASSCPYGMISNLSLNLDDQGSSLYRRWPIEEKTRKKIKEKKKPENATSFGEKKGNQEKIGNREKNLTYQ